MGNINLMGQNGTRHAVSDISENLIELKAVSPDFHISTTQKTSENTNVQMSIIDLVLREKRIYIASIFILDFLKLLI